MLHQCSPTSGNNEIVFYEARPSLGRSLIRSVGRSVGRSVARSVARSLARSLGKRGRTSRVFCKSHKDYLRTKVQAMIPYRSKTHLLIDMNFQQFQPNHSLNQNYEVVLVRTDGRTVGRTVGRTDGRTNGRTVGRTAWATNTG